MQEEENRPRAEVSAVMILLQSKEVNLNTRRNQV